MQEKKKREKQTAGKETTLLFPYMFKHGLSNADFVNSRNDGEENDFVIVRVLCQAGSLVERPLRIGTGKEASRDETTGTTGTKERGKKKKQKTQENSQTKAF